MLKKKKRGFTLVEVVVVACIISVIMSILIPSYVEYLDKTRHTEDMAAENFARDAAFVQYHSSGAFSNLYWDKSTESLIDSPPVSGYGRHRHKDAYITVSFEEGWVEPKLSWSVDSPKHDENLCSVGIALLGDSSESTLSEGESVDIPYSGSVATVSIPKTGLYRLEVWGAQNGGYSVGYKVLEKGTVLYVCCGEAPRSQRGGYNGGGSTWYEMGYIAPYGGGGGATHIALVDGILSSLSSQMDKVLIVAGGGGYGTAGGGLSGVDHCFYKGGNQYGYTYGGTQTRAGYCSNGGGYGSFGKGGDGSRYSGGGGGGWYGGGGGYSAKNDSVSGAGGSGYIGGVPEVTYKGVVYSPSTEANKNSGNGRAKVTLLEKVVPGYN